MTTTKDRQRAAARARLEREMAERAAQAAKRRKQTGTIAAVVGGVVVVLLAVWIIVAVAGGDGSKKAAASPSESANTNGAACSWLPNPDPSASADPSESPAAPNPNLKDVGTPPATVPNSGDSTMTITTNAGTITASLDVKNAPCASASLAYLASKGFYNNTSCHRLVNQGFYVLQCGDPSGTGTGGPTYTYGTENLPYGKRPTYLTGDIAIANTGAENSNGSQFFIVYRDTPDGADDGSGQPASALAANYTLVGHVTMGIDVVQKIAAGGVEGDSGDGKPKLPLNISTLAVTTPPAPSASDSTTPAPQPSTTS